MKYTIYGETHYPVEAKPEIVGPDGIVLTPEEARRIKIVSSCSHEGEIIQSENEVDPRRSYHRVGDSMEAPLFLLYLRKKHDPSTEHTDRAILFEREFMVKIDNCKAETGVTIEVNEKIANGRLEITRKGGATVTDLQTADRYYLDLQRVLNDRQGYYDTKDKNVAYEGLWRKHNLSKCTLSEIAKDINEVICESLKIELKHGWGYDYALYLASLFMPEKKARELIDYGGENLKNDNPPFERDYPVCKEQVHDKLKWWKETKEHKTFIKIKSKG